jgi:hypothetical protein
MIKIKIEKTSNKILNNQHVTNMDDRHRLHWLLTRSFMETVAESGGVVFGGAVRDWILHDHNSKLFYRHFWAQPEYEGASDELVNEKFRDTSFHPESVDRLVIPRDIDMVVRRSAFAKLTENLEKKGFHLDRIYLEQPVDEYLIKKTGIPAGSIHHERYFVEGVNPEFDAKVLSQFAEVIRHDVSQVMHKLFASLLLPKLAADMIVIDDDHCNISIGPVGRIDFDVNSLVWDANGLHTSDLYMKRKTPYNCSTQLQDIIDNIIHKRAVILMSPFDDLAQHINRRTRKLLNKGWTVNLSNFLENVSVESDRELYTGLCMCCQVPFSEFECKYFKMRCCDGRCHSASCMLQIIKNHCKVKHSCPMCRTVFQPLRVRECIDETILQLMHEYPKQTMCFKRPTFKTEGRPKLMRSVSF